MKLQLTLLCNEEEVISGTVAMQLHGIQYIQ